MKKILMFMGLALLCLSSHAQTEIKLSTFWSRGPSFRYGIGFETRFSERWSVAPMVGINGTSGIVDGYRIRGMGLDVVLPVRYYFWFSQPEEKAGPFASAHLHLARSSASVSGEFKTVATAFGPGIGAGWKAVAGPVSFEAFFNVTPLGFISGYAEAYDSRYGWERVSISAFPHVNYTGGMAVGYRF